MITEKDLNTAIAECQGKRNPDARTCIMLAAFYTIKKEMFGEKIPDFSFAPAPSRNTIYLDSDSEFARAVDGRDQEAVMPIIDELMGTLKIVQPRLFHAVMDKLT